MEAVRENQLVGRPKKFGNEETEALNCRVPQSLRAYVDAGKPDVLPTDVVIAALRLHQALGELLQPALTDLRVSAAVHDKTDYVDEPAKTIARLVLQALKAEKPSKK